MAHPLHVNKVTLSYIDIKILLGTYSMDNANTYNSPPVGIKHALTDQQIIQFNK